MKNPIKASVRETIDNLKIIKRAICAYRAPLGGMCDCKFGLKPGTRENWFQLPMGEVGCGCPELIVAINHLERLDRMSPIEQIVKELGSELSADE